MTSGTSAAPATPLDALRGALRAASGYNRADAAPPAAVLWTDKERRWESIVPRLRGDVPILTLGPYAPAHPSFSQAPTNPKKYCNRTATGPIQAGTRRTGSLANISKNPAKQGNYRTQRYGPKWVVASS